jgi:2-isopropylmalate synthase
MQLAWMLDYYGVDAIEISPIVSESHREATKSIIKAGLSATIVAHVRALRQDIDVALECEADFIAMYHSVSDIHLKHKLRITRDEALRRSIDAVEYAKSHGVKLRFTAEDASRADPEFLKTICRQVAKAGADRISLPDTTGVMTPAGIHHMVSMIRRVVDTPLDMHCHNDLGLALANSLAGVEAGASQIHVTVDGMGERVGLVSLAEASLTLILLYGMKMPVKIDALRELSSLVETYTGLRTPDSKPIVGENAYKHKAGTHAAAVIRNPQAYEIVNPKAVGARRKIVYGALTGRGGTAFLLNALGLKVNPDDALALSQGLKGLGRADLFEMELSEEQEGRLKSV